MGLVFVVLFCVGLVLPFAEPQSSRLIAVHVSCTFQLTSNDSNYLKKKSLNSTERKDAKVLIFLKQNWTFEGLEPLWFTDETTLNDSLSTIHLTWKEWENILIASKIVILKLYGWLSWNYRRWDNKDSTPNKNIYVSYNIVKFISDGSRKEFMILLWTRSLLVLNAVIHYQQRIKSSTKDGTLICNSLLLRCFCSCYDYYCYSVSAAFPSC